MSIVAASPAGPPPPTKRGGMRTALLALFHLAAALGLVAYFHRSTLFPLDRITSYENDPAQMVWNLWVARHEVVQGHSPFHTDLVFPPAGANLTHHTLASGYLPLTLLAVAIGGDQVSTYIIAYNLALWVSLAATFILMFLTAREVGAPRLAALGVALAVGLSSFYKSNFQNLNHVSAFFFPLVCWLAIRFWRRGGLRDLYGLAASAALAFYFTETIVFAGMLGILVLALLLLWPSGREELRVRLRETGWRHLAAATALGAVLVAPFLVAFYQESIPAYDLSSHSRFSANLAGYFLPTLQTSPHYFPAIGAWSSKVTVGVDGTWVFLGYPLLLGGLAGCALMRRRERFVVFAAVFVFLLLGLGPFLKYFGTATDITLPYRWLMDHPPLKGSRTPARLVLPAIVMLGIAAAAAWGCLAARVKGRAAHIALYVGMAGWVGWVLVEVDSVGGPKEAWVPPPALHQVEAGAVLTLPLEMVHGYIGLAQIVHGQPTISGTVVRLSPAMNEVWWHANNAVDAGGAELRQYLVAHHVRTVILPCVFPFDERSERHLQRSLEMPGILRIDSRPAPRFFAGTPAEPTGEFGGAALNADPERPLKLASPVPLSGREIEAGLEPDVEWECELARGETVVARFPLASPVLANSSLRIRRLPLPAEAQDKPFDHLSLRPLNKSGARIAYIHFR